MSIETLKGATEQELRAKLAELTGENFKARFTTEAMNPKRGAEIKVRRREIARIMTVLSGRKAAARHEAKAKQLEAVLAASKPHEGTVDQKRRRAVTAAELKKGKRAVRELSVFKGGAK